MKQTKQRLLFALLLTTFLPLLILFGYSLYTLYQQQNRHYTLLLKSQLSLNTERMQNRLDDFANDTRFLRDSGAVQLYLSSFPPKTPQIETKESTKEKAQGEEENTDTKPQTATRQLSHQGLLQKNIEFSFQEFIDKKAYYTQIQFIDNDGNVLVSVQHRKSQKKGNTSEGKFKPSNLEKKAAANLTSSFAFKQAIKLPPDELYISPLHLSRKGADLEYPIRSIIHYAIPVFDRQKQRQGVIILTALGDNLLQIIAQLDSKKVQPLLVDSKGYFLYHPDESKTWGGPNDLATNITFSADNEAMAKVVDPQKNYATVQTPDRILAYQSVRAGIEKQIMGTFILSIPKSTVYNPLKTYLKIGLATLLLALLLTSLQLSRLNSLLITPLLKLKGSISRMILGDFNSPVPVVSQDEVGQLSEQLEELRQTLRYTQQNTPGEQQQ